jgi:hypothetical protein
MAAKVELAPMQRLNRPMVMSRVSRRLRTYDSDPATSRASKIPPEAMPPLAAPLSPELRRS